MNEAHRQLCASGYEPLVSWITEQGDRALTGWASVTLIEQLEKDSRFIRTPFWRLHRDVGSDLVDFRGVRGEFGSGAMQFVIDRETGRCYVDVDGWSPVDVVGTVMHLCSDVWKIGRG